MPRCERSEKRSAGTTRAPIARPACAISGESHVAELQLHIAEIIKVKKVSHVSYAIGRGLGTEATPE